MVSWLALKALDLRPSTHRQYRTYWRRLQPHLGHIRLQALTHTDVRRAYSKVDGLGDSTLHSHHIVLHVALQDAVKAKLIRENPATGAHKSHVEPKSEVWTRQDIIRFRRSTAGHPLHLLFVIAVETGLRRGEILGLRWRDVDSDARRIKVTHQISPGGRRQSEAKGVVGLGPTKTSRSKRSVPLGDRTTGLPADHRVAQRALRSMLGLVASDDDLVFAHPDGRPLTPTVVTRVFRQLVESLRMPKMTFHGLRRSFAAIQLSYGTNIATVSRALGHSRPAFTLLMYAPFLPLVDEEAIRRVAKSMADDEEPAEFDDCRTAD